MGQIVSEEIDADGTLFFTVMDQASGILLYRQALSHDLQPPAVRRRNEAREAVEDWHLLRELRAELVSGGQAYWDGIAPDASLPTGAAAYSAALTFLTTRRDKAMSRAAAAVNRWRQA